MLPFLHFLELRRPGIFFEAHAEIRSHLEVCRTFVTAASDENEIWSADLIRDLNLPFTRALTLAMNQATQLEERHGGVSQQDCVDMIVEVGWEYGAYAMDQFGEWETNPVLRLGGVGATSGGPEHASWLVEQGKPQLRRAMGKILHLMPAMVQKAYDDPVYNPTTGGPMRLLSEETPECRKLLLRHASA